MVCCGSLGRCWDLAFLFNEFYATPCRLGLRPPHGSGPCVGPNAPPERSIGFADALLIPHGGRVFCPDDVGCYAVLRDNTITGQTGSRGGWGDGAKMAPSAAAEPSVEDEALMMDAAELKKDSLPVLVTCGHVSDWFNPTSIRAASLTSRRGARSWSGLQGPEAEVSSGDARVQPCCPVSRPSFRMSHGYDEKIAWLDGEDNRVGESQQKATSEWCPEHAIPERSLTDLLNRQLNCSTEAATKAALTALIVIGRRQELCSRIWVEQRSLHPSSRSASSKTLVAGMASLSPFLYSW